MNMKAGILFCSIVLVLIFCGRTNADNTFTVGGIRLTKNVKPLKEIRAHNIIRQSLDFSCGAAGLSTLLNYYLDDPVTEADIITYLLHKVPLEKVKARRGFSLYDLKSFAQDKGYKVTGYKMDLDFLRGLKKPVLVPIRFRNYQHFVIVKGVMADRVFIADPAAGNMSLKIDKFEKMWLNGIGLVVEHIEDHPSDYALKIKEEDLIIADYLVLKNILGPGRVLTTIYPNEF